MSNSQAIVLDAALRKSTGSHFTPTVLADFVAKKILREWEKQNHTRTIRVLDPAVGDGELLYSLLNLLYEKFNGDVEVSGFDTNSEATLLSRLRLTQDFPQASISLHCEDFLSFVLENYSPGSNASLFNPLPKHCFDLVIANPPYVRTQVLGAKKAQRLAAQFGLSGRTDLYHAFILGIAQVLRPGGILGIIVSNRFMSTKSGFSVRESIKRFFDLLHIWDLGDTRLFGAAVLPAVLLMQKKDDHFHGRDTKFTSVYSTSEGVTSRRCTNIIEALSKEGIIEVPSGQKFVIRQGKLSSDGNPSGIWKLSSDGSRAWVDSVAANTLCTFGEIGKIHVGVKTTADKVFIRSDWQDMPACERPELLRPLITHHSARRFRGITPIRQILYPHHLVQGKRAPVNLQNYPRSKRYLEAHRPTLENRQYVIAAGRHWFEIWVPQDPDAWGHPKLVFRDIAEKPTFWMDMDGTIVNGDCYWLPCNNPATIDLFWLALSVSNSSFIEEFYDRQFNNKLYAGRRRFITQYVEKFPLPSPEARISKKLIQIAKKLYEIVPSPQADQLEMELDLLVWRAFGFSGKEISR